MKYFKILLLVLLMQANNTTAQANLTMVEYFLDNDPGFGNGTLITVPANTTDYANQIININPALIADGIHTFYIRSKNADGTWSHTNRLLFNKPENNSVAAPTANLTTVEYFLDNDPGFGNGTLITVPANTTDYANQIININPALITDGIHILYIRSKNADGAWSHTNKLLFYKPEVANSNNLISKIKYAEYFIDTDPGYFNAAQIAITPNTDIANIVISTNITGLTTGSHKFFIRGIDSLGKWSHTDSLAFNVTSAIPAPAIVVSSVSKLAMCATDTFYVGYQATGTFMGNIHTVQLSNAAGSFAFPTIVGTKITNKLADTIKCKLPTNLAAGSGYLIRVVNNNDAVEPYPYSQPINITAATNTFTLTNDVVVNGNLNLANPPNAIFPCFAGGKIILGNFNLRVNGAISGFDNNNFIVTNGSGTLCINNAASQNNIYPVANNINSTNFITINNTGTPDIFCVNLKPQVLKNGTTGNVVTTSVIKNTWNITEAVAGGSNANLTVFWSLADELPNFNRASCYISHFTGGAYDIAANTIALGINPYNTTRNNVSSFSPFVVTSSGSVLPISLLNFSGKIIGNESLLNWQTTNEINSKHFLIQRSVDGINFTNVDTVKAAGFSTTIKNYSYKDDINNIVSSPIYYRLQQYDANGKFIYSNIIILKKYSNTNTITIFTNPVKNILQIQAYFAKNGAAVLNIIGADGKTIIQKNITIIKGINNIELDVNTLASSVYFIKIENETNSYIQKFVKQ